MESKNYTENEKIAAQYDVDVKLVHKCVLETSSITGSSVADVHKCVMERIHGSQSDMDLPYIPEDVQGVMFGMFPPKEFIKICTLNIQHAENCKKAWYWKAYLSNKGRREYKYVLNFLLKHRYEDNYKLFLEILGDFVKKYQNEFDALNKYYDEDGGIIGDEELAPEVEDILDIIEYLDSVLLRYHAQYYDRNIHGDFSDMTPDSKYYKDYKNIKDYLDNLAHISEGWGLEEDADDQEIEEFNIFKKTVIKYKDREAKAREKAKK